MTQHERAGAAMINYTIFSSSPFPLREMFVRCAGAELWIYESSSGLVLLKMIASC